MTQQDDAGAPPRSPVIDLEPWQRFRALSHKKGWVIVSDAEEDESPVFSTLDRAYSHLDWLCEGRFLLTIEARQLRRAPSTEAQQSPEGT
jgi:hypothetical protein